MRNYLIQEGSTRPARSYAQRATSSEVSRLLEPVELADWVESRLTRISRRWYLDVERRDGLGDGPMSNVMEEFLHLLVCFLPGLIGARRDQVDSLWAQASELFGTMAARRGLAAGEVVEEFQILRESVVRLLYQDPPLGGRVPLSLREVLRLNRAIDRGVTHASVGYTDALFFSLFEGSGVPDPPRTDDLVGELKVQLVSLRKELRELLGRMPGEGYLGELQDE
jgi:hypothetical protein